MRDYLPARDQLIQQKPSTRVLSQSKTTRKRAHLEIMGKTIPQPKGEGAGAKKTPRDVTGLLPPNTGACRKDEMIFVPDEDKRRGIAAGRIVGLCGKGRQLAVVSGSDVLIMIRDKSNSSPSVLFCSSDQPWPMIDEFKERFGTNNNGHSTVESGLGQKQLAALLKSHKESMVVIPKSCFPVGAELRGDTQSFAPGRSHAGATSTDMSRLQAGETSHFDLYINATGNNSGLSSLDFMSEFNFSNDAAAIQLNGDGNNGQAQLWRNAHANGGMAVLPRLVLV